MCTYEIFSRRKLASSASRLKCGLKRLNGMLRTSAMAVMLCCFSKPMNFSNVWLEWPMVNSVGCAELAGVEFFGADTWAV